jgi:FkbM family methyltransferase
VAKKEEVDLTGIQAGGTRIDGDRQAWVRPDLDGGRSTSLELLRKARKLARLARRPGYRRALRKGVAAAVEHEVIPYRPDLRTVVDVGAHKGQFATFARERFPASSIICLEPLPEPRRVLGSVMDGDGRVRIYDVAASNRTEEQVEMHVSRLDDSSSLQPIGSRQVAAFPGTEEAGSTWVRTTRLDALVDRLDLVAPALLKIDVQGHEYEVLEGAAGILPGFEQVVAEVSFAELYQGQKLAGDVTALLHDGGFALAGVFNLRQARSGACLQADFLFERAGRGG